MNPARRHEIFRRWREANPHPKSDLEYTTPFELLVAVILSAQATDKGVNAATHRLFPVANTPAAIAALGEDGLAPYIQTIGLWRAKAKNVVATCRLLLERHGGAVPAAREALESLPGVGRKTANVVLNIAFGQPTIAVDTHNFRVANRTGIAPGRTVEAVERALVKVVPAEFMHHAHHWLILHGRYTCKAQKPACPDCLISDLCEYRHKTPDPLAEAAAPRPAAGKARAKKPATNPSAPKAVPATKTGATKTAAVQATATQGAATGGAATRGAATKAAVTRAATKTAATKTAATRPAAKPPATTGPAPVRKAARRGT
ncbi:MAG: endonuclease III [Burkholderiales bacterium]|nr:endonuclease III [Burkholderiales bacterium]